MTEVWGLTGGIATGKSTVSAWLKQAGLKIIDADVIARQVVAPGTPGLRKVLVAFGPNYQLADGRLNRRKLGRLVFSAPAALRRLEAITTPLIQTAIQQQLATYRQQQVPAVVIDAPTFYEVGYLIRLVDHVMVVAISPTIQQQRLMARDGLSASAAQARMAQQWPITKKVALADVVIDNAGTIAETRQQVVKWLDTTNLGSSAAILTEGLD
ncbi:dephospho-CoA kinase [Levilactobacillus tujiorum]|uniref:Dephospho-CoA kinase n=1 Tax=Levilactobacillus tujiorum TaxID=2912243 RepID=A0ABX1L6K3_9LACO|nr:dephospho-CoA kinase [Levilactobacillus tujiorum]MCH5464532.1 dephospho-CoA kinase [Levilactobacillus tujiorum]NLR11770.1 dephospho-CoA kinase [Lactobacillus sp. HBUAS51387]NLR29512.1 dephospho-CoA kinase [Levilactobacillus tujiorum]